MADYPASVFRVCTFHRGFLEKFNVRSQLVLERIPPGGPESLGSFLFSSDGCHHGDTSLPLSALPSLELPVEFLRL